MDANKVKELLQNLETLAQMPLLQVYMLVAEAGMSERETYVLMTVILSYAKARN